MDRPNILFLFSDEHSFRYMGYMANDGGEPCSTPAFDQLAMGGTVFTDAYCQMPLCTPSRLCVLTGREAARAGAWTNQSVLRPDLPTMAQVLGEAGYETCLVGKMHLGGNRQFAGFHHRPYGDLTVKCGHQWEPLGDERRSSMRTRTTGAGVTEVPESLIQDRVVATETLGFIREHAAARPDKPWFVCASFSRPHFPLTAPKRHLDKYWPEGVTPPPISAGGDAYDHPMSKGMRHGFQADAIEEQEMMRARAAYFACVSYLDEVIGDLFLQLEKNSLLENTIIVYTTDHGEMAGEHGVWWKNGWYEGCTRVPLIVSTPHQRRGDQPRRVHRIPVALIDLFPTFCGLAGAQKPAGLDGIDLSPCLLGDEEPPRRAIPCDNLTPRWGEGTEFRSLRLDDYKYVRFRNAPPLLFNVVADPGEQHNLIASENPADVAARNELEALAATLDFDAAQHAREQDHDLHRRFPLDAPQSTGNLYLMPSGLVINADDPLYHPTIITDTPRRTFSDWPDSR